MHQAIMKRIFPLVRRRFNRSGCGAVELEMVYDSSDSSPLESEFNKLIVAC